MFRALVKRGQSSPASMAMAAARFLSEWKALPREWIPDLGLLFKGQARRFIRDAMVIEVRLRRQSGSPGAHTGEPP